MAKDQVAGAIILDTLRERIISGVYLGFWRPGDRLPSIREIAEAEEVDRKTAAAAYRRLNEEGLVRVQPRSGVYLALPSSPSPDGPLERLHRQWLEHVYHGARALGLDTPTILRFVAAVSEIERMRIPVVECTWAQADAIAAELRERLSLHATAYLLEELRPSDPVLAEAPVAVTTPYHGAEFALLAPGQAFIEATLAPEVLSALRRRLDTHRRLVIVADGEVAVVKIRRALAHGHFGRNGGPVQIVSTDDRNELLVAARRARAVFLWPGTPDWVDKALPPHVERFRPSRIVSDESLARIQAAVLGAALRRARSAVMAERVRA